MIKERIILAFVAIAAGVLVASSLFFFYQGKKPGEDENKQTQKQQDQAQPDSLTIDNPEDQAIVDKKSLEVKGKTTPKTLVIISSNQQDYAIQSNDDGSFSQVVNLDDNENDILVNAYPQQGASVSKEVTVTYSTEDL